MFFHLLQFCSLDSKNENIENLLQHLAQQNLNSGDLVLLPENSLFMRQNMTHKVEPFYLGDPHLLPLQSFAKQHQIMLHLGAIPWQQDGRVYNSSVHILPDGSVVESYRKIHLFDVDVLGEKRIRESDTYTCGDKLSLFEYGGWKIGQTICYDLRFSYLYLDYSKLGADIILVPSSFLYTTGKDHWEVLLRARAIESQAFILAAAQGGEHKGGAKTWGQSMAIDPWGHVLQQISQSSNQIQSIRFQLDSSLLQKARAQIPLANHRKVF